MRTPRKIKTLPVDPARRLAVRKAMSKVHVIPLGERTWTVQRFWPEIPRETFETKQAAMRRAKELSPTGVLGISLHGKPVADREDG